MPHGKNMISCFTLVVDKHCPIGEDELEATPISDDLKKAIFSLRENNNARYSGEGIWKYAGKEEVEDKIKQQEKPSRGSTGQTEIKIAKKILAMLNALLSTDKELSARLCAVLEEIERLIHRKVHESKMCRRARKEERERKKREEESELAEAKRNAAWT